ncbi:MULTISPECIES: hypothetical protein [unclassified Halorubrum]|uniref:hypothetical protein n=1 Tax=unclassified Halorubrum TaxID=2642239 RepID=UPI0003DD2C28|nr:MULTISPECIES: hypothetical protein [unclassified Halorubrum]CDK38374.1 hypothetical protein BN903_49 [Halorubrum sp. AJ67]
MRSAVTDSAVKPATHAATTSAITKVPTPISFSTVRSRVGARARRSNTQLTSGLTTYRPGRYSAAATTRNSAICAGRPTYFEASPVVTYGAVIPDTPVGEK